jgi:hypothetical protein
LCVEKNDEEGAAGGRKHHRRFRVQVNLFRQSFLILNY